MGASGCQNRLPKVTHCSPARATGEAATTEVYFSWAQLESSPWGFLGNSLPLTN